MSRPPAAAWVAVQMRRSMARWSPATRAVVRSYLRHLHRDRRRESPFDEPFWILLPRWLHAGSSPRVQRALGPRFLTDVIWAQYCLFLFVRIHDDLFDRQAGDMRLLFVADQLLIEGERTFAVHAGRGFPALYRAALDSTLSGILTVDARAREGRSADLSMHAEIASVFKVGASLVAMATGRTRTLPSLIALMDELAVLSQALDDLADLGEDLQNGRLNPVAALILGKRVRHPSAALLPHLGRQLVAGPGADRLVGNLRRRARRASVSAAELKLPQAIRYVESVTANIEKLAMQIHRAQVGAQFSGFVGAKSGPPLRCVSVVRGDGSAPVAERQRAGLQQEARVHQRRG